MKRKNVDPLKVPGPLAPVMPGFVASPGLAAPKRSEEIKALVAKHRIRIELNNRSSTVDFAVHQDRRIRAPLRGLEHLWGSLYAYLTLYDLTKANRGALVDLTASPEGQIAQQFLLWAFGDPDAPWPLGLPQPKDTGVRLAQAANNLFILSCGFILLHEVGHVVLGHLNQPATNPETRIKREYQADDWAVDYIVTANEPSRLAPPLIAAAAALGVIGGLELYGEAGDERHHPFPPDRIRHFGEKVVAATTDVSTISACLLAAGIPIQAHLLRNGVALMQPYQTFDAYFTEAKRHYRS